MTENCPLMARNIMKKTTERGYLESFSAEAENIVMLRWNDNSQVTVCSNFESVNPKSTVRRWSQAKKDYVHVQQPQMVKNYNRYMRGTDQMDQQLATYHPTIKNRKWYFPIFVFMLKAAC